MRGFWRIRYCRGQSNFLLKQFRCNSKEKETGSEDHDKGFGDVFDGSDEMSFHEVALDIRNSWENPPAEDASGSSSQSWSGRWKQEDGVDQGHGEPR